MPETVVRCRQLIEEARVLYKHGEKKAGFAKLDELSDIVDNIPKAVP